MFASLCIANDLYDPNRVTTNECRLVTPRCQLAATRGDEDSNKEINVRRTLMSLAVAIVTVTVTTPVSPAAASERPVHTHHVHHLSPRALARQRLALHREKLQLETQHALGVMASHLHVTLGQLVQMWQRVAICEVNGNWAMEGPYYSGIGFANSTWVHYGGLRYAPDAGRATRMEQIRVGMAVTQTYVPDQYGCSPYGW